MIIDELLEAGAPPIVAILRGVKPDEVIEIGAALVEAGIRMIEVPLNSPEPFTSVAILQDRFGDRALIGAGTVLYTSSVDLLANTGAKLLVSPNTDTSVIRRGIEKELDVMPGVLTPSEALAAIGAGARKLKLFPAFAFGPSYLKAIREVLPQEVGIWAVGGVGQGNVREWLNAGAEGVALGGALYRPGFAAADVRARARDVIAALGT